MKKNEPIGDIASRFLDGNFSKRMLTRGKWIPNTDIYETEKCFVVVVELAGVKKEEIQLQQHNSELIISGVRNAPETGTSQILMVHQLEIDFGTFEKVITLPKRADLTRIEATFFDGYLIINIIKEKDSGKTIDIEII